MQLEPAERTIYLRMLAPLLLAAVTLVIVSIGGFHLLSGARAYVSGESLWSKASSQTIAMLRAHLTGTASRNTCAPLAESLAVPLGDRDARLALEQPSPDLARARDGFLRGGNPSDDAAAMIQLYRYFGDSMLLRDSVAAWRRGDALIDRLRELGERICASPAGGAGAEAGALLTALDQISADLLVEEARFSASLGESSRRAEELLTAMTALLAALLVGGGTWFVMRSLRAQVAQRRALMDSNDRWRLAADAAGMGVFVWHLDTDRFELDPRAASFYGFETSTPMVFPRTDLRELLHPEDRGIALRVAQSAIEGAPLKARYRVVRSDGSIRHVDAAGMMRDKTSPAGKRRLFGVMRDITDELMTLQLQHERDAAERVARARTEFLSRLSHELRTPLNAVLGMAQVLEVDEEEPLGPQQRQRVEMILQSGWHLLRLVDDVLDITRIDAGVVAIKPIATDLRSVLRSGLALVEPERLRFDARIVDEWPEQTALVMADPQRLQQVLVNLISNACKYNRRGGRVTLGHRETAGELALTVTDEGDGIAPAQLAELFQPFKRLAATADVPGTGLGLVVVKLLVEQMGGRIEVESEPDHGACFVVWLAKA